MKAGVVHGNIPYVATISPVIADLAGNIANPVRSQALWRWPEVGGDPPEP